MDRILPTYARQIPDYTIHAIHDWVDHGYPPGGFLQAVLCNDLKGCVERADSENIQVIPLIVKYLYNCVPSACWGSIEKYNEWEEWKYNERKTSSV